MSLPALHSRYHRLQSEHAAWRLLRAVNAPLIMAFVAELFREESEVPFGRARVMLQSELDRLADDGREVEKGAGAYLREWSQAGWLRELDDQLTATDACDVALRFCQNLEQREVNASASHLRIVQDAVTQLAVDLSPNPQERITLLEHKKAALQHEIDQLKGGVVHELSAAEQRERIREVYQLASVLTGDFRRVEDDIRGLDQSLRVQMIESEGPVREDVLAKRIARAHGWARTGKRIRDRVYLLAEQQYPMTTEEVGQFFWPEGSDTCEWSVFRYSENGSRPVDEISIQELKVLAGELELDTGSQEENVVAMARLIGIKRLKSDVKERLVGSLKTS